jgi:hypothetical protein
MHDDRDELDRILDSALTTYADPGADSGLDSRILGRIALQAAPTPRRRWLPWAIALPVAGSLLFFAMLFRPGANHTPSSSTQQAQVTPQPPAAPAQAAHQQAPRAASIGRAAAPLHKSHPRRIAVAARLTRLPKLDVFPTPQPITPQVQNLAQSVARMSQSQRHALTQSQPQEVPFTVASMHSLSIASIPAPPVESIPTLSFRSPEAIRLGPPVEDEN